MIFIIYIPRAFTSPPTKSRKIDHSRRNSDRSQVSETTRYFYNKNNPLHENYCEERILVQEPENLAASSLPRHPRVPYSTCSRQVFWGDIPMAS